ncbi:hypothetical protein [Erwinia rhapontici]|uniref:hypothetical protein n=1 Tax=Erwinia rhapontici TaxID=55212 RepID=UPI00105CDC6E|nr:hypothetical protein [Erwinia rhapontici]TDS92942.1 hypothetical protein EDF84_112114 [Erwinia rhapontici]
MPEKILFVFEGEKTEHVLTKRFISEYFSSRDETIIKVSFCGEIYQLYRQLKSDPMGIEYVDIFPLLKERDPKLEPYSRDEFSQIYMFFDYDPHASQANIESLREMLTVFSEETDKGNLFVSYPMVESLRCCNGNFEEFFSLAVHLTEVPKFKSFVDLYARKTKYNDVPKWDLNLWQEVISLNCIKANHLVNESKQFPDEHIEQGLILEKQRIKSEEEQSVYVLNAFPLMFLSHFGRNSEKVLRGLGFSADSSDGSH